jgi:hypothetical protein
MSVRTTSVNSGGETGLIKYFAAPTKRLSGSGMRSSGIDFLDMFDPRKGSAEAGGGG